MKIFINSHYLSRVTTGLSRYARQVGHAFAGYDVRHIKVPTVLYKFRLLRFISIFLFELIAPTLLLIFSRRSVHISPAFSVPIFATERNIVVVHDLAFLEFEIDYGLHERLYQKLNLWLLCRSRSRIVTPSLYVKTQLEEVLKIRFDRITVVSPYSELSTALLSEPTRDRYFCLLSTGHPRKNIDATVNGFLASNASKSGINLYLIGNFEVPLQLDDSPFISRFSGIDDESLASLISGSEALLLFSKSEGFGFPVVEAASLGVPTLTSNVTSLIEINGGIDGDATFISCEDIRVKINRFISDGVYRESLSANVARLNKKYSKSSFEEKWRALVDG